VRVAGLVLAAAVGTFALDACSSLSPGVGPPLIACTDVDSNPGQNVSFRLQIRPLMDRTNDDPSGHGCITCHYSTQPSHACTDITGLDVATLGALRQGGVLSGANIIIPGKPCESALVQKLQGDYFQGLQMPKDGPPFWSGEQIQLVKDWIVEGAIGEDDE
jgi:hypothetical protein